MRSKDCEHLKRIGLNIAHYRKLANMTQIQLAEKANVSRTFLGSIEAANVQVSISIETLFDIADALNIKPSQLLNFDF